MPRPLWTGSIAFGLVTVPIQLHRAVKDARPRFRLLHAKDKSPVRLERVCQREGHPVAWDDLVRGYEYEKGKFVTLTREDLAAAALEKTNTVDILDFVDAGDIDDRFFETPYYVLPTRGGERAYAVLREAMRNSGKTGVAKVMLRQTQHLAALEAIGDALVLTMMRFPDELVDLSEFRFPAASTVRSREVDMASALIGQLTAEWSPDKYTDDYQANLMRVIRAKVKGRAPDLKAEEPDARQAEVVDLMERLQKSLGKRGQTRGTVQPRGGTARTARKRSARKKPRRAAAVA
jgi:DNA end-binding protein Ku